MDVHGWAALATILLVIEAFFMGLVPAVILILCVRGMGWILSRLGLYAPKVQGVFRQAADVAERTSQRVAAPFISASVAGTQVHHWTSRRALKTFFFASASTNKGG